MDLYKTWQTRSKIAKSHTAPLKRVCVRPHSEMWAFANSDAIRHAMHARSTHEIGRFDECSDRITYTSDRGATMLPVHADLVSRGTCRRRPPASIASLF